MTLHVSNSGNSVTNTHPGRRILLLYSGLALLFIGCVTAHAQISVGVTPIRAEHQVQAGQSKTDRLIVENKSPMPLHMKVSVADWYLTKDGDPVFVKRGKFPESSMSEWIEVNPAEFDLESDGRQILRYTMEVPPETPAGGYRAAIMVESVPEIAADHAANVTYLTARIGVVIYDQVGTVPTQAEITDQKIVADPENPENLAVRLTIANGGLTHFRFKGECRILDNGGGVAQSLTVPEAVILPGTERFVLLKLKEAPPPGSFTIVSRLDVGLKELLEAKTHITRNP